DTLAQLMRPWRSAPGTVLLVTAFFVHYANALWSIYERRSLRLTRWQWAQLGLGLCIPVLLAQHVATTRLAEQYLGTDSSYNSILLLQWLISPRLAVIQAVALLTVWIHACIGIHFWLRTKLWYADWRIGFFAVALLLPTLALSGFLAAGNEVLREAAKDAAFAKTVLGDASLTDDALAAAKGIAGAISLAPPNELEAKALARIAAIPGMRLACQIRPTADLAITPLCAADASAADGYVPGGLEGAERLITVMFVDLRGSTTLGEAKLPYDVLFILNRFFYEMKQSLEATNGHYSQFTGDGLRALYGLHAD